ncbi:MAG: hypothetical protein P4K93_01215 [Terracidiphilus sp.]|nr:hypothetical protein [Terracidiphilus sp.]MDR3796738.1 hypothetical protein [Terracidiphilus sp.]
MNPQAKPLHFRGAPLRLTATSVELGQVPKSGFAFFPGAAPLPLRVRTIRETNPSVTQLSFRLPKTTSPGRYDGKVELGGCEMPIRIEVHARPQMRFYPPWLSLEAHPGERLEINVSAVNQGNVKVPIERRSTFCLLEPRGVDVAIYHALTEEPPPNQRRLDRAAEGIAESHGGLVRATVREGAGDLAPGEFRELLVELHFSDRVKPRRTYYGAWFLGESGLGIQVEGTQPPEGI